MFINASGWNGATGGSGVVGYEAAAAEPAFVRFRLGARWAAEHDAAVHIGKAFRSPHNPLLAPIEMFGVKAKSLETKDA